MQVGHGYEIRANDSERTVIEKVDEDTPFDATNTTSPDASLDAVHIADFLNGVRTGAATTSPIDEGHKSVLLCQLANIAWATGHILEIDTSNGHVKGDPEAEKHWGREYEPGWEPAV